MANCRRTRIVQMRAALDQNKVDVRNGCMHKRLLPFSLNHKKFIMKSIITIVTISLFGLLPVAFVHGQGSPKPAPGEKSAAPAGSGKRTDVYHVHFTKAALGKAVQLGDWLKTPDQSNPMPDHFIVLRHKDGKGQ